jgi:hypothetical protein
MSAWRTEALVMPVLVEIGARHAQHVAAGIDADGATIEPGEQFEDTAGAGAKIEQRIDRLAAEQPDDGRVDLFVGGMQAAKLVPFGRIAAEIGLRPLGALALDRIEPLAVAQDDRIVLGGVRQQAPDEAAALPSCFSRK